LSKLHVHTLPVTYRYVTGNLPVSYR